MYAASKTTFIVKIEKSLKNINLNYKKIFQTVLYDQNNYG